MTDTLIPEELVRLAVYSGHRAFIWSNRVWLGDASQAKDEHMAQWQPHLDANQRDELVEALRRNECHILQEWYNPIMQRVGQPPGDTLPPCSALVCSAAGSYRDWADTPGLAVCRAALKVIGEQNAD